MASITIRQLGDDLKQRLRLRAARNGRSMEDEARTILRDAASLEAGRIEARTEAHQRAAPRGRVVADTPARAAAGAHATGTQHILLIIGGGIAAYKALDLIRRLKERGLAVRCILTKAAQEFITPLSAGALAGESAFPGLFHPGKEVHRRPHPVGAPRALRPGSPATPGPIAQPPGGPAARL